MIRKLLRRVFRLGASDRQPSHEPALIPVERHGIRREAISPGALKTVMRMQEAGFKAFVVGGAVRDLLAGITPKDYDIATNATPDEVKNLFRRSRIIGRRFQIVHVMNGAETLEVSTFRAGSGEGDQQTSKDEHGRILRDNIFGSQEEDASRRDFTVNALYYDPAAETIVDFHHGVADLQQKTLRMIGDPRARYREDPVRMLRAARLSAKLGLTLDPAAKAPIREMAVLLENVPVSRLFDEMLKLLLSGNAVLCLKQLRDEGLHHGLLPLLDVILEQPMGERFVWLSLANTDQRVRAGKPVSPGFLFATLLWHEVLAAWELRKKAGEPSIPALFESMNEVLNVQGEKLAITRRIASDIKDIWLLQPRLDANTGKRPLRLLEQPRFRAGYDFLLLRAESGEVPMALADWWKRFIEAEPEERLVMLQPEKPDSKKPRRRRRKPTGGTEGAADTADGETAPTQPLVSSP
jgi:poly(A) polymerase